MLRDYRLTKAYLHPQRKFISQMKEESTIFFARRRFQANFLIKSATYTPENTVGTNWNVQECVGLSIVILS